MMRVLLIAGAPALLLAGCVAKGGMMQVDVEVYKGPLSKTVEVQYEELCAKVADAGRAAASQLREVDALRHYPLPAKGFLRGRYDAACAPDCAQKAALQTDLQWANDKVSNRSTSPVVSSCMTFRVERNILATSIRKKRGYLERIEARRDRGEKLTGPEAKAERTAEAEIAELESDLQAEANELVGLVARFGAELRDRATYWSSVQAAQPARNEYVRGMINQFAIFAAEYGNQIVSRVDALQMQHQTVADVYPWFLSDKDGKQKFVDLLSPAQRLATSVYLRDSNPTAYQNLLDWNERRRPDPLFKGMNNLDRVRMAEQLMSDAYWSNINTVHANGLGKTQMAFVKDDTGNWNLKSFSSDPSELIQAYNNFARTMVSEAISLASGRAGAAEVAKVSGKVSGAQKLLALSDRALVGKGAGANALDPQRVGTLRGRVKERLVAVHEQLKLDRAESAAALAVRDAELKNANNERIPLAAERECLVNSIVDLTKEPTEACAVHVKPADGETDDTNEAVEEDADLAGGSGAVADADELRRRLDEVDSKLAEEDAKIADLSAQHAAAQKAVADIEKAAVERARVILRDHAVVIGTIEELLAPSAETAAPTAEEAAD